jgi:hypothetical protein
MASNGTYGVVYCGTDGLGVGVFNLKDSVVVGADYSGGRYRGTATETANGNITLDLTFDVPSGIELVQGTAPQDAAARRITQTLPAEFGDGTPVEFETGQGIVTAMIKRVPDEFEPAAFYGFTLVANPPPA